HIRILPNLVPEKSLLSDLVKFRYLFQTLLHIDKKRQCGIGIFLRYEDETFFKVPQSLRTSENTIGHFFFLFLIRSSPRCFIFSKSFFVSGVALPLSRPSNNRASSFCCCRL